MCNVTYGRGAVPFRVKSYRRRDSVTERLDVAARVNI